MSDKQKVPRAAALAVAKELCDALKPVTEKLIVAGSLRRRKAEVGDVEIVYISKVEMQADPGDLLGHKVPTNLVHTLLESLLLRGVLEKRLNVNGKAAWGYENKLARHKASGIGVDFFQADKDNWFSLLVCRTGSAESNTAICMAAEDRGLKWNPYKGFLDRTTEQLNFVPRSEEQVFSWVGLPYKQPWER